MSVKKPISTKYTNNNTKKYKLKKEVTLTLCAISIIGGTLFVNNIRDKVEERKEIELQQKIEHDKKIAEENKIKKLQAKFPNLSKKGFETAYDANIIWDRLQKGDYSKLDNQKVVFLTYDDGPSRTNTPKILDTLDKHNVKATFFVTGKTLEDGGETAKELVTRAYNSGHSLANHSYSHDYKILYPNRTLDFETFKNDFAKTDKILEDVLQTSFKTKVWRCPGGLMSWKGMEPLKDYAKSQGIGLIDWNALNKDAEGKKKNADELFQEAVKTSQGKDMIVLLMHDTYGKEETAKYTDRIIQYYKDNGYVFKTLA